MPDYEVLNVPLLAANLAASRVPRIQETAQAEYRDWVSREVTIGNWNVDPKDGSPIHTSGRNLKADFEHWLEPRPHAFVPVELEAPTDDTWTSGNITKQGARLKQLRAFCGSDAAALVLLTEEAASFGVKPFTTEKGEKIGAKPADARKVANASNPWGQAFVDREGQEAAYTERARLMRTLKITACAALAAAAGKTITGAPLR